MVVVVVVAAATTAVGTEVLVPAPSPLLAATSTRIVLPAFVLTSVKVELPPFATFLHAPPTASHCFQVYVKAIGFVPFHVPVLAVST